MVGAKALHAADLRLRQAKPAHSHLPLDILRFCSNRIDILYMFHVFNNSAISTDITVAVGPPK